MHYQSEQSPQSVKREQQSVAELHTELGPPLAADYLYRIAAITIGIFLLATVV
jgi:hypothetical protein